jgi:two-component system, OmpR family, alkaline phosphatase synthesis response regulator PhoP
MAIMSKKILVVEDEKDLLNLLKYNLKNEGYNLLCAKNAEEALPIVRSKSPDLIVLDIMLPEMDGLDLCKIIRQESQVPIIFLTAKKNELDRILGLKLGADDYITKPFSIGELVARIQSILRRVSDTPKNGEAKKVVRLGMIEADFDRHEIRVNGKNVSLPPKEFQLFKLLIEANGKVRSREFLVEKIWGFDKASEIDTRTIDQHIARLRRKLDAEKERIVTVSNFGYQVKLN